MKTTMKKATILSTLLLAFSLNSVEAQVTNGDYPKMIKVEGGTFPMGDSRIDGSKPVHEVTLSTYYISETPVTVKHYRKFCDATGRSMPEEPEWGWQDNHPIVDVNFNDAVAYCNWLGQEYEGNFRLPTEAEWEYAARGGNKSKNYKYSGSDNWETVGWLIFNSNEQTQAVGQKKANELGIFDMSGNVWEWCSDWYDKDYYSNSPKDNPKGPTSGSNRVVIRGGCWFDVANDCRVAYRDYTSPDDRFECLGFRVVLSE